MSKEELAALRRRYNEREKKIEERRQADLHSLTLDPVPRARRRFERKMVIKSLEKRRVGKAVQIARTERESVYKSQEFPTSVKKMMRLTRLVAGKTVEEALIQLRFSKKRVARDLVKALQIARDEAIAARGMGLGAGVSPAQAALEKKLIKEGRMQPHEKTSVYVADGTRKRQAKGEKTVIELKDGSTKAVADPTEIYIDQAWASKASEQKSPEFRARGKVNLLTHRSTSKSLLAIHFSATSNHTQGLTCCSRRRRRACVSQTRSRRSAQRSRCGCPCAIDPSSHNGNTACGRDAGTVADSCTICIPNDVPSQRRRANTVNSMYNIPFKNIHTYTHPSMHKNHILPHHPKQAHASSGYPSSFPDRQ